ncbi:hypothetical protein Syun_019283 [Stephania yunnanensis]|uniref:Uncharacterized protein n=1 Tax=Stephania yunnanensis TaxID=152371 RepID=A0AAP0IW80_9MAGN
MNKISKWSSQAVFSGFDVAEVEEEVYELEIGRMGDSDEVPRPIWLHEAVRRETW